MEPSSSDLELLLKGYRLTTAEITYHLPDHPHLLQIFLWQQLDLPPDFPRLKTFLEFWQHNIEGQIHQVQVARSSHLASRDLKAHNLEFHYF